MGKAFLASAAMAAMTLAASSASAVVEPELLTNGGFESGDFTGWSVASYPKPSVVSTEARIKPYEGTYFARLVGVGCTNCRNPVPNGYLNQTVSDLAAGEDLTLTYWENDTYSGKSSPLTLKFGVPGALQKSATIAIGDAVKGWQEYGATFITTASTEEISFQWQTAPAYFYGLDDVSLVDPPGVPEPAAWALMLAGFSGLGAALRSKRNRVTQANA